MRYHELYRVGLRRWLLLFGSFALACLFWASFDSLNISRARYRLLPTPTCEENTTGSEKPSRLPVAYTPVADESSFCADRFGIPYLEALRDSATQYCTPQSSSSITCFHSSTVRDESRQDTFCFLQSVGFDPKQPKFNVGCELLDSTQPGSPKYGTFHNYWYDTGPGIILGRYVQLDQTWDNGHPDGSNYTILVKREGSRNYWHSLMEIYSMTLTIDVLQMTRRPNSSNPFITPEDAVNTQVVLVDDHDDGPYFDLWTLFAKKPVLRLKDIPENASIGNVIVPLAGGSNTLWQGDWEALSCQNSVLLNTFVNRVLSIFGLGGHKPQHDEPIVVTFINRTGGRRFIDGEEYLRQVEADFPLVKVQSIDFAAIPYKQQLEIIQTTDILVGVHGAGLTHGIFLPPGSSMVEILPPGLNHKGFRNVAFLRGHLYFSTHASNPPRRKRSDWHSDDVYIEKERFMDVMNIAIKALYNKGSRNYDVN